MHGNSGEKDKCKYFLFGVSPENCHSQVSLRTQSVYSRVIKSYTSCTTSRHHLSLLWLAWFNLSLFTRGFCYSMPSTIVSITSHIWRDNFWCVIASFISLLMSLWVFCAQAVTHLHTDRRARWNQAASYILKRQLGCHMECGRKVHATAAAIEVKKRLISISSREINDCMMVFAALKASSQIDFIITFTIVMWKRSLSSDLYLFCPTAQLVHIQQLMTTFWQRQLQQRDITSCSVGERSTKAEYTVVHKIKSIIARAPAMQKRMRIACSASSSQHVRTFSTICFHCK